MAVHSWKNYQDYTSCLPFPARDQVLLLCRTANLSLRQTLAMTAVFVLV